MSAADEKEETSPDPDGQRAAHLNLVAALKLFADSVRDVKAAREKQVLRVQEEQKAYDHRMSEMKAIMESAARELTTPPSGCGSIGPPPSTGTSITNPEPSESSYSTFESSVSAKAVKGAARLSVVSNANPDKVCRVHNIPAKFLEKTFFLYR